MPTLIKKISTRQWKRNYVGQYEILIKFVRVQYTLYIHVRKINDVTVFVNSGNLRFKLLLQ